MGRPYGTNIRELPEPWKRGFVRGATVRSAVKKRVFVDNQGILELFAAHAIIIGMNWNPLETKV